MQYFIEQVNQPSIPEMLNFLKQHENYSLFLLGNFENHGITLSEAPYSGNYKFIRSSDKIVGICCLTRKGSLLIEAPLDQSLFDVLLASCLKEPMPITGLVGNWDFCNLFWKYLKDQRIIQNEIFTSKEILYTFDLAKTHYPTQPNVRLLTNSDYIEWKPLRLNHLIEAGLPEDLTENQLLEIFQSKVRQNIIWGYFLNNKLVSIADLNAKASDLGQVGGVYTAPNFRQKGFSRSVMKQLLFDAKKLHAIRKLIIFTGETNFPAQKLYESLGVDHVGYFALLFGN